MHQPLQSLMPRMIPLLLISLAVLLQLTSSVILKSLADRPHATLLLLGLGIAAACGVNLLRVVIWVVANRRYPLSTLYPMTSLFFPAILGVSCLYGNRPAWNQLLGTALITLGVLWLSCRTSLPSKGQSP